jgi:hypothetical protein
MMYRCEVRRAARVFLFSLPLAKSCRFRYYVRRKLSASFSGLDKWLLL